MINTEWSCLYGHILDSRYRIEQSLQSVGNDAFFRALDLSEGQHYLVRMQPKDASCAQVKLNRFREAQYLDHPNLLRVVASGETECKTLPFTYVLSEMASSHLAETTDGQSLTLDEVSDVVRQIAAALTFLHSENFVYCALAAESIWRVGNQWKLANYAELRVAGRYPPRETRSLLLSPSLNAPPEANEGLVSEAWDVWSLGSLVRKLLLNQERLSGVESEPGRPVSWSRLSVPYPFSAVLRDSLEPSPSERATLEQIVELVLAPSGSSAVIRPAVAPVAPEQSSSAPTKDATDRSTGSFLPQAAQLSRKPEPIPMISVVKPKLASRPIDPPRFLMAPAQNKRKKEAAGVAVMAALALFGLFFFSRYAQSHSGSPAGSGENLVRASLHSVREGPVTIKEGGSPKNRSEVASADQVEAQKEISLLLNEWVSSTRSRDVEAKMQCYAPLVNRFYGQRSVSASRLADQVADVFARIGTVRKFDIRNIQFNRVEPESAVVSFDNDWTFGGDRPFSGSVRDELVLRPVEGHWKITSQRELKVYWTNR